MSITDSSRASPPAHRPSTTPLPTYTRRLNISAKARIVAIPPGADPVPAGTLRHAAAARLGVRSVTLGGYTSGGRQRVLMGSAQMRSSRSNGHAPA